VSQAKPVNYVGAFSSAGDPLLEQIWYAGAYTVRATLQANYMGSILEDRGDRISWTGDAHPTQITSMVAFANYAFVLNNLNRTSCADCCNGIATYCLYFVLSVVDFWRETRDAATLAYFVPIVAAKLEAAYALFPNPHSLRFVGHDDRLGNGFCNSTTPETQMVYRFLLGDGLIEPRYCLGADTDGALPCTLTLTQSPSSRSQRLFRFNFLPVSPFPSPTPPFSV
jgi:hypothetical protein